MQNLNSTMSNGDGMMEATEIVNQHHPYANGNGNNNTNTTHDLDNDFHDQDEEVIRTTWNFAKREVRHNPCVMHPISIVLLVLFCISTLVTLAFQIPSLVLGLLLAPILNRTYWFVEFLYPMGIARWAHFYLIRMNSKNRGTELKKKQKKKNRKKSSSSESSSMAATAPQLLLEFPKAHSRCCEQRVEVVKDRVYIHPIPQLLDNLGYLIICLPPKGSAYTGQIPIVASLIDCGDAHACMEYMEVIRQLHYPFYHKAPLELQSVLCTHKHHDHTAGNYDLMHNNDKLVLSDTTNLNVRYIYGGAVERVPYCNRHVVNGDVLELPCATGNDMNDFVSMEVIAVPCHTRGSVVYALRAKSRTFVLQESSTSSIITAQDDQDTIIPSTPAFLFTGDTMFSGGGGVPFEADTEHKNDHKLSKKHANSHIRPTAGSNALERCFAEILARGASVVGSGDGSGDAMDNILIFPGHEYTNELLSRQLSSSQPAKMEESCQWSKLPPSVFFKLASNYYVANHRRTLPKKGKLLTVPTPLSREMVINPYLRIMKRRGQHVIIAIKLWHRYFAKKTVHDIRESQKQQQQEQNLAHVNGITTKASFSGTMAGASSASINSSPGLELSTPVFSRNNSRINGGDNSNNRKKLHSSTPKTPSTSNSWNMVANDFSKPVFTTVYSADLENVIQGLSNQQMDASTAVQLLSSMQQKLESTPVGRRPIPATLPTERTVYQGILGLTLLGSRPSALTLSDSRIMKLPAPHQDNDRLRISKKRLIRVLHSLGLLTEENSGQDIILMIHLLWNEAEAYNGTDAPGKQEDASLNVKPTDKQNYNATTTTANNIIDLESNGNKKTSSTMDEIELGVLKWILYGIKFHPSWFSRFCMPCGGKKSNRTATLRRLDKDDTPHPVTTCNMRRSNGELVRHDVETCPVCITLVDGTYCSDATLATATSSSNNQSGGGDGGKYGTSQTPPRPAAATSSNLLSHGSSIIGDSSSELPSDEGEEAEGVELEVNVQDFMLPEHTTNDTYFDENVGAMRPTRSW